jgi:hypothetical protein
VDPLFTPRLTMVAKDSRLGGLKKPTIGVGSIDLTKKLPWSEHYEPPNAMGTNTAPRQIAAQPKEGKLKVGASSQGAINSPMHAQPTALSQDDAESDDEMEPPKYMENREVLHGETEDVVASPFETYALHRGQKRLGGRKGMDQLGSSLEIGSFKGVVRVIESPDVAPLFDLKELFSPQPLAVRIYVLRGRGFTPMDIGVGGSQGKSDPYLRLSLGKVGFVHFRSSSCPVLVFLTECAPSVNSCRRASMIARTTSMTRLIPTSSRALR